VSGGDPSLGQAHSCLATPVDNRRARRSGGRLFNGTVASGNRPLGELRDDTNPGENN
jgi:hypothetical protein